MNLSVPVSLRGLLTLLAAVALICPAAAETIEGTLRSDAGHSCSGTRLIFVSKSSANSVCVETDHKGGFQVDLPAGEYRVYRSEGKARDFVSLLKVPKGQVLNVELTDQGGLQDRSLTAIRDYTTQTADADSKQLSELINPFPVRKQGQFYGSLYEYHRNDNFDARNFFDPVGEPLPEYKRNQFGGTLGTFLGSGTSLQGSYDGLRIIQGTTILSHVPTERMQRGDFSELGQDVVDPLTGRPFPGNRIPEERIDPIARKLLSVVPTPNRGDPDRNYVNNDPRIRDQNHFSARGDLETANNATLVGDYAYTGVDQTRVATVPAFDSSLSERYQNASVSYSRALSQNLLTFLRIEFGRSRTYSLSRNSGRSGLLDSLEIQGLQVTDPIEEGYPMFWLTGYADFGDRNSPDTAVRNQFGVSTSLTYVHGTHTLRGGFNMAAIQLNNQRSDGAHRGVFSFSGRFSGDGFADFLLGYPDSADRGVGSDRADLRRRRWEAFFRDQWRIVPNLELSYGVNYEFSPPYHSIQENVSGFDPLLFEPPRNGEIVVAGSRRAGELGFGDAVPGSLLFADRNDWSPRLGLAYNPLGSNRLVVRGGYSIWHDFPGDWLFIQSLTRNYPFYYLESAEVSQGEPPLSLSDPFTSSVEPQLIVNGMVPHLSTPYTQTWRLGIENEPVENWNVGINYVGQKGTHSTRLIPGNVPTPGPGPVQPRRPNPAYGRFGIVNDGGSYTGHSLDLSAERRLVRGFSLRSGFEWNRFLDDSVWGSPQNPRDLRSERATATWLPRRRFYLNYIVDLPMRSVFYMTDSYPWLRWVMDGWRLSGITEIRDGRPFTVTMSGDPNNDGVYGDRPDRVGSGVLPAGERSVDQWFDTSAFAAPSEYGFGTSGRSILLGPGYQTWDVSVIKQTRFSDGDSLELRVELFNALNQVNFDRPNTDYSDPSLFGKIFGADRAREIELAVKYSF